MKRLIVVRHGNTFRQHESPRRVGSRTDLPLVEEDRARWAGRFLADRGIRPDAIYTSPLQRTMETARLIKEESGAECGIRILHSLSEIDYGPDENKTEQEVYARLGRCLPYRPDKQTGGNEELPEAAVLRRGRAAVDLWNSEAVPPLGWTVDVAGIIAAWRGLARDIAEGANVLAVSSNGIIRFVPRILADEDYEAFRKTERMKVATGSVSIFEATDGKWRCAVWNAKKE